VPTSLDPQNLFPFPLDEFQQQAIAALDAGKSVVVCAPTGSGKTLIGEYAIYRALANKRRVFYTTPLKALSNQKLHDFQQQFGEENAGLLTGDISVNRDAAVVVMTTEIFRNMLYGTPIGQIGISLSDVEAVILDECHYMNDRQRGTVWEESVIYCPPEIQLVGLSATIANGDQLRDWIDRVHGPTELIYSDFRPVPLQFHFCNRKGLYPLLDKSDSKLNPRLKPKSKSRSRGRRPDPLGPSYVLSHLQQRDMLPAIYFIFSRRGCDRSVGDMGDLCLVDEQESAQLKAIVDNFLARNPDAARAGQVEPLYRGIAAHHAGILPAWKGLVEHLFRKGLIKVVFATETLAAGINMPARTTVISSLSKRTDNGHRLLTASEFLQMSGRAGRRGMDAVGYVVTLQTPFEGATEAAHLATVGPDPLVSQFTPTYGMVLNLLQTHTIDEARSLVERSFGQYLATLHLLPQQAEIGSLEAKRDRLQKQISGIDPAAITEYEKLQQHLREERRLLKTLQKQADKLRGQELSAALNFAVPGTVLSLQSPTGSLTAVLVNKLDRNGIPISVCLGADNSWYEVKPDAVLALHAECPRVSAVDGLTPPQNCPSPGDETTLNVVRQIPAPPPPQLTPEVVEWQQRVVNLERELADHPLHQFDDPGKVIKYAKRVRKLQSKADRLHNKLEKGLEYYWNEFVKLIEILREFDALDEKLVPTKLGETAAALRGENELWLGLALSSGAIASLDAPQFAAACAALVMETPRPDSWTNYKLSGDVDEALAKVRGIRRRLFQVQHRYDIALPVWLERDLVAIVEEWANGAEWSVLFENTSLDEGDIVRLLRRTLDVLSQIPHVPHLSEEMVTQSRDAARSIDRFPVSEE